MKIEHRAQGLDLSDLNLTKKQTIMLDDAIINFKNKNPRAKQLIIEWDFLKQIVDKIK